MNQLLTGLALFLGEVFIIGAVLLIYGYTFGYQAFKNIWIVTALSIAGILIVEPLVAWFLFHQTPTTGAFIALILGVLGIAAAIFIK